MLNVTENNIKHSKSCVPLHLNTCISVLYCSPRTFTGRIYGNTILKVTPLLASIRSDKESVPNRYLLGLLG